MSTLSTHLRYSPAHRPPLKAHPHASPLLLPLPTHPHPFPIKSPKTLTPSPTPTPTSLPAGRRKNPPTNTGRIEGGSAIRREAKQNARRRGRRLAENLFYRRNRSKPSPNSPDSFTDEELNAIGLGYDRLVRFLPKDDPSLRHPHDWYKYGRYGPYSWRGIVVGPPIRGRFSDDRVTLYSEVDSHDDWDVIEQFDMTSDFDPALRALDLARGVRYYWVFVRHPKWRAGELPWQQWTLACEVAVEAAEDQRLDKWSLMGRFGNSTRAAITRCAAWQRPDIIYVKKPVYQCRFEPQEGFFGALVPLVDPRTENEFLCELRNEDGRVEICTYFAGLCKIVKVSPKAYVDDVVKGYEKLSDEGKSRCLEFLLTNHPTELLHPYTKEWKAKLEEMELGCDAPDGSDDDNWVEDEEEDVDDEDEDDEDEDDDDDGSNDEAIDVKDARTDPEETPEYWSDQWKKAIRSSGEMEKLVKKTMEVADKYHEQQMMEEKEMEERSKEESRRAVDEKWEQEQDGGEEEEIRSKEGRRRFFGENWESRGYRGQGSKRRLMKSRIPPELFLRAAVRPFTYRNLVKEIVLMRHAIIDGDIKRV